MLYLIRRSDCNIRNKRLILLGLRVQRHKGSTHFCDSYELGGNFSLNNRGLFNTYQHSRKYFRGNDDDLVATKALSRLVAPRMVWFIFNLVLWCLWLLLVKKIKKRETNKSKNQLLSFLNSTRLIRASNSRAFWSDIGVVFWSDTGRDALWSNAGVVAW